MRAFCTLSEMPQRDLKQELSWCALNCLPDEADLPLLTLRTLGESVCCASIYLCDYLELGRSCPDTFLPLQPEPIFLLLGPQPCWIYLLTLTKCTWRWSLTMFCSPNSYLVEGRDTVFPNIKKMSLPNLLVGALTFLLALCLTAIAVSLCTCNLSPDIMDQARLFKLHDALFWLNRLCKGGSFLLPFNILS